MGYIIRKVNKEENNPLLMRTQKKAGRSIEGKRITATPV